MRLLSCEVSVIFSQQVPCGVWECLFSDSIMSSAHSLPEVANLRVEIVPDRQTSFVRKTTATSAITESDYTGTATPRIPLALNWPGDESVDSQSKVEEAKPNTKSVCVCVCVKKGVQCGDWLDRCRHEGECSDKYVQPVKLCHYTVRCQR